MGGGGVKAPEVETENAAALKHAVEMIPQRQPAQTAKGDQTIIIVALATAKRQKMETGAATGPCCKNGDPGRAPDNNDQPIE